MVHLHKDLLQGREQCWGGGYYEMDFVGNRLVLSGESYDFGPPRWDWLQTLKVPAGYRGLRLVYLSGNSYEDDVVVSDMLHIEYVD